MRIRSKIKCTHVQALRLCTGRTAHSGSRGIALTFHDHGTRRGEGSASRPGRSLPPGKTRYPLYRRLGGPQGWSGQVRTISPPPGFDPRTVQSVASRYTDDATRSTWIRRQNFISHSACTCMRKPLYFQCVALASCAANSAKFQAMHFRIPIGVQISVALQCVIRWL